MARATFLSLKGYDCRLTAWNVFNYDARWNFGLFEDYLKLRLFEIICFRSFEKYLKRYLRLFLIELFEIICIQIV